MRLPPAFMCNGTSGEICCATVAGAETARSPRSIVAKYELHGIGRNDRFPCDPGESDQLSGIPNEVRAPRIIDLDRARCARADHVADIACIAGICEDASCLRAG